MIRGSQILALLRPHERYTRRADELRRPGQRWRRGGGHGHGNSPGKSKSAAAADQAVSTEKATDTDTHTETLASASMPTGASCGHLVLSHVHVGSGPGGGLYAKHALLAELRPVSFASELWVDENQIVHVNNSSGTYRPDDALLPAVEKFLAKALGLTVHAHRRPDKDAQQ